MSGLDLLIALRAARRDLRYTIVNLIGLSAAFAGALLIGLYVLHEHSFERWLPNVEKTAIIHSQWINPGQHNDPFLATQFVLAPEIDGRIPGVERVARVWDQQVDTVVDGRVEYQEYLAIDPSFLEMVPFPAVEGDPALAIAQPRTLVVTQRFAEKWFGVREGVLGKTVRLRLKGELVPFTVGAVIKNAAGPTHLNLQAFYKLDRNDYEEQFIFDNWGSFTWRTYLQLSPGADLAAIKQALDNTFEEGKRRQWGEDDDVDFGTTYGVVPLRDLHLNTPELRANGESGDRTFVLGLTAAGFLILFLAMANFAALSSAMAARRARESALRRTLGASKQAVALQFLGEGVGFAAISLGSGLILLSLILPAFNALMNLELSVQPLFAPSGIAVLVGVGLITGLLGGLAPALTVARMDPARVLAGGGAGARGSAARVRFVVVAAQYAISAALIAGALISYAQVQHMAKAETNFDPEGMIVIEDAVRPAATRLDALLQVLRTTPGVVALTTGSNAPAFGDNNSDSLVKPGGAQVSLQRQAVGEGYLDTYKTRLLAGRWFDPARPEDDSARPDGGGWTLNQNVVLNEAAVRALELPSAEAAVGGVYRAGDRTLRVIGVVADQAFDTLKAPPRGVYYHHNRLEIDTVAVRFQGVDQPAALRAAENAWRRVYPDLPVEIQPVDTLLWDLYAIERRQTYALAGFSGLAVLLAALGAYALSAHSAERRGREMAIRRIVGADGISVAGLHLRRALVPAAIGAALAAPLAIAGAERWLAGFETRINGAFAYGLAAGAAVLALAVIAAAVEAVALARTPPGKTLQAA